MKTPILSQLPTRKIFLADDLETELPAQGIDAVMAYLGKLKSNLPQQVEWYLDSWELVNDSGKLVKRISRLLHVRDCYKMSDDEKTRLGNIIGQYSPPKTILAYDFNRTLEWEPGTFGEDEGSCYWGRNSIARTMIRNHGGMAIRFWKNCKYVPGPISWGHDSRRVYRWHEGERYVSWGRAWLIEPVQEAPENVVLFNPYGISLDNASRIMAHHLGTNYRCIYLSLHGDSAGPLYINDNSAALIGESRVDSVNLLWEKCWVICDFCENPTLYSLKRKNKHGDVYCPKCWPYQVTQTEE